MKDLLEGIKILGIPTVIGAILIGIYLIIDFKSKVLPEVISLKRYFEKRKAKKAEALQEQTRQKQILEDLQTKMNDMKTSVDNSLKEMQSHYTPEKLAQRDAWMAWVDSRALVYDASVEKLLEVKDALHANNELTLDLYINLNRNRIIDFASKVANENAMVSREEFRRIFKTYDEYEAILEKHGKTNGEVEVSIRIIREAYEVHMRNHTFIEDCRGY